MSTSMPGSSPVSAPEIRVLLVDDSALVIELIRRMLAGVPGIVVVGAAGDGAQALQLIPKLHPDVVCTDLHMPIMDGYQLTREIMARHPLPILVLSVSVQAEQEHNIFQALQAGALDILAKPRGAPGPDFGVMAHDLVTKIRILSGVKVSKRRSSATLHRPALAWLAPPQIVGLGASTGGPQALERILRQLPASYPLPLICVQHIAAGFMQALVDWLNGCCRIRVCCAEEGLAPQPGTAYFAPDQRHIEVDDAGLLRCSSALVPGGQRPSVDLSFHALARHYGAGAVGVLLTGMGQDGAQGMLDIVRAGGLTIAQDQESSVVFGMPRCAIEQGGARHVLALEQIGPALCALAPPPALNTARRPA
jgi:two-component system chemotaxis response regulator CheB